MEAQEYEGVRLSAVHQKLIDRHVELLEAWYKATERAIELHRDEEALELDGDPLAAIDIRSYRRKVECQAEYDSRDLDLLVTVLNIL